jgi:hypothetical protein
VHLLVDGAGLRLCGAGERLAEERGAKRRRSWRKPHLAADADTGHVVASTPTDKDAGDGCQAGPLPDRIGSPVASTAADGALDRDDVHAGAAARHADAAVAVPPRPGAAPSGTAETAPTRRDAHLRCIAERGRMGWRKASGCNWRAPVEADMARWKRVTGDGPRPRTDGRRAAGAAIAAGVPNRMPDLGRPEHVRIA